MLRLSLLLAAVLVGCDASDPAADMDAATTEAERLIAAVDERYPTENHDFRWEYSSETDPMTDKVSRTACITSSNALMLSPPYEPTRLRLCLRDHPQHGRDAYVHMLKSGQFLYRSYDTGTVLLRFDDGPIEKFSAIGSADGSSEIFFIQNRSRLEKALADASVTLVQPEVYQAGVQTIAFDTKGFSWPAPGAAAPAP